MANEVSKLAIGHQQNSPDRNPCDWRAAAPERLAISSAIRTAGWRKFVQRRDVTRPPSRSSGTVEFVAKPQLSDIKPKVGGRNPPPVQRLRPYFSPKLHPILGVPVRRLWK
jgi:hypothetical protein